MSDDRKLLERMYISDTIKHYESVFPFSNLLFVIHLQLCHEVLR